MKEKTCAFTGHRPQKLPFGFNEADELCATGIMQCFPNAAVRFCCKPDTHQTAWRNATATWSTTQTFSSPYGTAAPAEPGKPSNTRSSRESMS